MPGVVKVPITRQHASFTNHASVKLSSRIGRLDVKGRGGDAVLNGPIYRAPKNVFAVIVHAKNKAAVDHEPERMQAVGNRLVVSSQVLPFVAALKVVGRKGFKPDENAS